MLDLLKDKATYSKIIIKTLPLVFVATTGVYSLLTGIISFCAICLSSVAVSLLKPFLNEKTAPFAKVIISVGIVGTLTMCAELCMKQAVDKTAVYLPLISLTTVLITDTKKTLNDTFLNNLKSSAILGGFSTGMLIFVGIFREFFGLGSFFGLDVYTKFFAPIKFFAEPSGALFIMGVLAIVFNLLAAHLEKRWQA